MPQFGASSVFTGHDIDVNNWKISLNFEEKERLQETGGLKSRAFIMLSWRFSDVINVFMTCKHAGRNFMLSQIRFSH